MRSPEDWTVRNALASLTAARTRDGRSQPGAAAERRGPPSARSSAWWTPVLILVVGVVLGGGAILATGSTLDPACTPITYALRGSTPRYALTELNLALQEIHRRTGLEFAAGGLETSKLVVVWSNRRLPSRVSSPSSPDQGEAGLLGLGQGTWHRMHGGRELVAAEIRVDGTASWRLGMDRGDGLAAVFVHELGHAVIGLGHDPQPDSFMHEHASAQPPRWTDPDLDQLARAGRQAGCHPPEVRGNRGRKTT